MSSQYPGDPYSPYDPSSSYRESTYQEASHQQPAYQPPTYQQPIYQQPWVSGYPLIQPIIVVNPPTNGKAIASMVLGICIVLTACSFSVFSPLAALLGLGTGIPAVILGHMALRQINASSGTQGGHGMAVAGLALGYVSIAVGLIAASLAILLFGVLIPSLQQP